MRRIKLSRNELHRNNKITQAVKPQFASIQEKRLNIPQNAKIELQTRIINYTYITNLTNAEQYKLKSNQFLIKDTANEAEIVQNKMNNGQLLVSAVRVVQRYILQQLELSCISTPKSSEKDFKLLKYNNHLINQNYHYKIIIQVTLAVWSDNYHFIFHITQASLDTSSLDQLKIPEI
ncbi:Hypothetical_protein [Hexamita inflata]|uniref:Hypothetical_protein n=1 Tax=Hexamita inflata TaxID=28002 RepID=A0AA86TGA3_9EUKA|nr:Hypothetical protein HINF_LOCUS93 [Hexamita inflata]